MSNIRRYEDYHEDLERMTVFLLKKHTTEQIKPKEYFLEMFEAFKMADEGFMESANVKFTTYLMNALKIKLLKRYHEEKRARRLKIAVSLDKTIPGKDGDDETLHGKIGGNDKSQTPFDYIDIRFLLFHGLEPAEHVILTLKSEGYTVEEIARKIGKSRHMAQNVVWPKLRDKLKNRIRESGITLA